MKRLMLMLFIALPAVCAQSLPEISAFSQQQIFTHWVQTRCISKIADNASLKNDAQASAAAWLEASNLPVAAFEEADAATAQALQAKTGGSIKSDYRVLKCSLIAESQKIQALYNKYH
ncbi:MULTISPECIES: T6SS amidase immunity protein Tai4 family protein [Franconibacter]|uniref:T6SS amidase immunity protein Tai4 family protein n=1 Tax=Franconibacter daqui TaxID=2047724 RepID=A0ABV1PQ07_9ENTR|nr:MULTISPECIES: T6SS amidase immunity protein Tai4 family protein [Franconibacter]MCK1968491.1 type VI secretion system amidase immunity protein Tai4 [Franconibacter sp. IITDAS19]GGD20113.1 hypothetical protein GCM10011513_17000 [Franconibacter daqui]